jgi:hypothetical protein
VAVYAMALVACGAAPAPIVAEPVPSTDRDPPSWTPSAQLEPRTGEPVALAPSEGAEQARALLVTLVLAVRDGNEAGIEATLAERVAHAQTGLARTTWTRGTLARQILAGAAASHVDPDASFESLIDPATIRVVDVGSQYEGLPPTSVQATDAVLLFTPTALGRRLLAGLGSSSLVVRPGPTPVIVAR